MRLSSMMLGVLGLFTLILVGYMTYFGAYGRVYFYFLLFGMFALVFTYMTSPQIDWWWFQRNPPPMPVGQERQLGFQIPFYRNLGPVEKKRFRDRVMMAIEGKEFIPISFETIPEDVKNIIAGHLVMMTFGIEKYLLHPYERVVLYRHAFPSPNYKVLHSSEINHDDGCVIFDLERLMMGVAQPKKYYNLILHEYAHAYLKNHPESDIPDFTSLLEELKRIRGFGFDFVKKYVGLEDVDLRQAAIEHFFMSPLRFREYLPEEYKKMTEIFNLDPMGGEKPVLYINKIGVNPLAGE